MEEKFKCGCVNFGNFEFKVCHKHREFLLDAIEKEELENDNQKSSKEGK